MAIEPQQFGELRSDVKYIRSYIEANNERLQKIEKDVEKSKEDINLVKRTHAWAAGVVMGIGGLFGFFFDKMQSFVGKIF